MWSEARLQSIAGTQIEKDARAMRAQWLAAAELATASHSQLSVDEWMFCRASIQNRAISFQRRKTIDATGGGAFDGHLMHGKDAVETVVALVPYVTIANHDDNLGCSPSMGNGISHPDSSYVFRSDFKTYPGQQIYNSYGKISFQQKLLSFGWLDKAETTGWFSITVLPMDPSERTGSIELKTEAELQNDVPAKVRAASEERLRKEVLVAVRQFQERGGADGRGMARAEAVQAVDRALRQRGADIAQCAGGDADAEYLRGVEARAVEQLLQALSTVV